MAYAPSIARLLEKEPARLGTFRLIAELGEGGFAPVFVAVEEHGGVELRSVALKLFDLESLDAVESRTGNATRRPARQQIVDEARALCRVEHPNVVRFHQIVEEGSIVALAMEHVRGRALESRIDGEGVLTVDETLEVGVAIAGALAAVHAAGLIHRDVKPGNVIETSTGYKLIDFGIARAQRDGRASAPRVSVRGALPSAKKADTLPRGEATLVDVDGATLGHTGTQEDTLHQVAGTMGYIDPVCLAGRAPPDASSDLYALGVLLYECLTRRLPASVLDGDASSLRFGIAVGNQVPPSVLDLAPHIPPELARLVDSLVAPSRADRPRRAEWVACELERLRLVAHGSARNVLPPAGPFRGLDAFDAGDRDIYFGRSAEIASALEQLRVRGVVSLVGSSGCGKTSLARAGIAPAIMDGGLGPWPKTWRTLGLAPGSDPDDALRRALADVLPSGDGPILDRISRHIEETAEGVIIVVDALEELVTLAPPEARHTLTAFIDELSANPRPGLRLLLTLRRDLLDALLELPLLHRALTRDAMVVAPLSGDALVAGLDERLAAYGYALEDEVSRRALAAELVEASDSMPLVEFALARLWQERDEEKQVLPRASLQRIGGIAGALEQHAESTYAELVRTHGPATERALRGIFLALTTPQGTRARKTLRAITEEISGTEPLLRALERARLIVKNDGLYTLPHDALLRQWPRFARWVTDARHDRETAIEVEALALRWVARPRHDELLRGEVLKNAYRIVRTGQPRLTPNATRFVHASHGFDRRRTVGLVTLLVTVLLASVFLVGFYFWSDAEAEREKAKAKDAIKTLMDARNYPDSERTRVMLELTRDLHTCKRDLETCHGDAGTR